MNGVKRAAAAVMACLMVLSFTLGGCNAPGEGASIDGNAEETPVVYATKSETVTEPGTWEDFTGYPLNTDESLSIWASQLIPSNTLAGWEESPFHTNLEKQTGIRMEWNFPVQGADANQAFNLLLSDKELPDLLWHTMIDRAENYMEDGVIRDLTELLPEYAPNYWEFLQENPYYDRSMKTDSGRYFGFGFFREDRWQSAYMGPMVRKDWLDECGFEMPETVADWEEVLTAFKEKYGAYLSFVPNQRMTPGMAGAFGSYGTFELSLFVKDGKVEAAQAQPEWKEYMTWLHGLNEKGLIDPDVVTLDDAGLKTKIANNQVGMTNTSIGTLDTYREEARQAGSDSNWVGCPYPVLEKGDKTRAIFCEDPVIPSIISLTTSCPEEKLELALRWLDYAFTEDGFLFWNYGVEGESYVIKDGVPAFTDLVLKNPLGLTETSKLYTGNYGWGLGVQALGLSQQKVSDAAVKAGNLWYYGNEEAGAWVYPNGVTLTPDEIMESSGLYDALNTYVKEMSLKFLTGEESLDNWEAFVGKMTDMGMERVLEVRQAAYDRFRNR